MAYIGTDGLLWHYFVLFGLDKSAAVFSKTSSNGTPVFHAKLAWPMCPKMAQGQYFLLFCPDKLSPNTDFSRIRPRKRKSWSKVSVGKKWVAVWKIKIRFQEWCTKQTHPSQWKKNDFKSNYFIVYFQWNGDILYFIGVASLFYLINEHLIIKSKWSITVFPWK